MTGSFQSGYLAEVAVNGFTYHAMLFSPYLALATPPASYPQIAQSDKLMTEHSNDAAEATTGLETEGLDASVSGLKADGAIPPNVQPPPGVGYTVASDSTVGPE